VYQRELKAGVVASRQVNGERTLTLKVNRVQINTGITPAAFLSRVPATTTSHPRR